MKGQHNIQGILTYTNLKNLGVLTFVFKKAFVKALERINMFSIFPVKVDEICYFR